MVVVEGGGCCWGGWGGTSPLPSGSPHLKKNESDLLLHHQGDGERERGLLNLLLAKQDQDLDRDLLRKAVVGVVFAVGGPTGVVTKLRRGGGLVVRRRDGCVGTVKYNSRTYDPWLGSTAGKNPISTESCILCR